MKLDFDVSAKEYALLRDILEAHLPKGVKVWVFGSRAKNTARFNSDLDLALEGNEPISDIVIARLKDELSEALIPYRVDVLDIKSVSDKFREIIRQQAVPFDVVTSGQTPELRFSGFEDAWESAPISDWLYKVIDYRGKAPPKTETGIPLITARNVKMGHLDFEADEYIDSTLFEAWMNRGRPNSGDVMFTTEAPLGNVAQYPKQGTYALGQRIITLQADMDRCDSGFLFQTLLSPKMQRKVDARGTGSTAKGIKSRLFVKIPMSAPTLPEQRKIAGFLGAVDTKIAQLAQKKRLLEDYKKGCMQQLFSQKIRFKDDDGNDFPDWQEKRLGEVFTWASTNSFSRERLTYEGGQVQNIHYGDIHTKFSANFHQDAEPVPYVKDAAPTDFKQEQFCQVGDVVIADASEDYADIGKAVEIVSLGDVPLVAGLHTYIARPCRTLVQTGFPGYLLRSDPMRRQIERIAQGISVLGISKRNLEKLTFFLPHPAEQRKIADFLSALDHKIDLVGQELEHARSFKQGLLQQMFV